MDDKAILNRAKELYKRQMKENPELIYQITDDVDSVRKQCNKMLTEYKKRKSH